MDEVTNVHLDIMLDGWGDMLNLYYRYAFHDKEHLAEFMDGKCKEELKKLEDLYARYGVCVLLNMITYRNVSWLLMFLLWLIATLILWCAMSRRERKTFSMISLLSRSGRLILRVWKKSRPIWRFKVVEWLLNDNIIHFSCETVCFIDNHLNGSLC